MGKVIFKHCK